jgi:large subunit ribosomal protein L31
MKQEIHPNYDEITVACACGNSFKTRSTLGEALNIEICSECHPFFTGKQKLVDTAGRVDRFKRRYARGGQTETVTADAPAETVATAEV